MISLSSEGLEYMFLKGGNFMPDMEKLAGQLFFQQTNSFFRGKK
jgi:hypothetical protein